MKKIILKNKTYIKNILKINFFIKNKLNFRKKYLFFTKNNYLKTKNLIRLENKKQAKGNVLINLFR